ncbi:MAG: S8 family serine peptidase [Oscillospiraceae bacterium]|nr:S8 family serine peptidase [Oscillospiraceae bacterium]
MRSKKLLSCLLVLCMILSVVTPAANAVSRNNTVSAVTNNKDTGKPGANSLQISGKNPSLLHTLRNEKLNGISNALNGKWNVKPIDKDLDVSIMDTKLPDSVQELKDAAEDHAPDELVSAMVVLEQDALVNYYGSINDVPASDEKLLKNQQQAIIDAIEKQVLSGGKLTVDGQYTYLTNAIAITTEFGHLEQIACISGIESVFLMPVYYPCATEENVPMTIPSGNMCGVSSVWADSLGYTGTGMTIAILDTGLDMDHPSFAADPELGANSWTKEYVASMLDKLNASDLYSGLTADDLYYSAKVPFAFNYGSDILDVTHADGIGDHGTHVAGIAGANAVEGSGVVGMAPDAQIIVMKVFNPRGGAAMADIIEALEDAMILGVDVANLSLGSSAGFSSSAVDWIDELFASLADCNMIVNVSAGNDGHSAYGNMWGTNMNPTFAPDNAAIASPATYANASAIASVDNSMTLGNALLLNGAAYMYNDAVDLSVTFNSLAGQELQYVLVGGYGEAADFEGLDVAGKVAVVARGVTSFSSKLANAEAAGAIALIVTNNTPGSIATIGMAMTDEYGNLPEGVSGTVPAVLVSLATGEALAAAVSESYSLTVSAEPIQVIDEDGGQMSIFSSWGVSPDLRLVPDIAGVGGNVYSCYDGGEYGFMSGTSMSCPQVSGISALVLEYLQGVVEGEVSRDMLDGVLMSTAEPVIDKASGLEASPRQQGAGLVNALNAVTSGAYLSVDGGRPKAELGDDAAKAGVYSFTFTVHNFSDADKTYALSASLLTEAVDPEYAAMGLYFMAGYECVLDGTVSFSADSVTVAAGSTADITVTVTLSEAGKTWLDTYYPNGGYVEGFVHLENADENGVDLSLPYMGFYGDWTKADAFDSAFWYENTFWGLESADIVDGNQYYHILWTLLEGQDWIIGFNPYTGALEDENGNIAYDPANNVVSPNGDGNLDNIVDIYISLMRNAKELSFTYSDAVTGEVYHMDGIYNASKTMFLTNYNQIVPYIHSWYFAPYDFTDADGNVLPSGTELMLEVNAELDYGDGGDHTLRFPITVDTAAPELVQANSVSIDGSNYLVLTVSEDVNLAYVQVTNTAATQIVAQAIEFTEENGSYTVTLDITGAGSELLVTLCDYGANEASFEVTFNGDDNLPELDEDALYAYRVYDESNYFDESYYGWVTIDKETAEITQLTNDMYEHYALTAAEYIDGLIFAVDAGHNFLVIQPGTFFRTEICNLGMNVMDMTWDPVTNTMYLCGNATSDDGYSKNYYFSTIDLLTGELTHIKETYSSSYVPLAMAATDDGTIYAIKPSSSGLFTVNKETGAMTAVKDAEGNNLVLKRADGQKDAYPYYTQSMTYSSADGCLYWGFFNSSSYAELFKIVPAADGTATYSAVAFPVNAELVGMLTLDEDDDYTLPESDSLSILKISDTVLSMKEGDTHSLSVECLPWNYEITTPVTWSSSDDSIVSVDENGNIVALSEGQAVITAECEGVTAECVVSVIRVEGVVYGYDYYSGAGYGDWFGVSLPEMYYASLAYSPVDFVAAEYNGHDGYIYGYTESKQFYRYSIYTGECELLGTGNTLPYDMAYDYSTGYMYAMDSANYALYYVNMENGNLVKVGDCMDYYIGMACSTDGILYAVNTMGMLFELIPMPEYSYVDAMPVMEGLPSGQLLQSMTYDHNTGKIIWPCADQTTFVLIDLELGAFVELGDPTESGLFEFVGMFTIPTEVPALAYVPVESVTAEDMMVFVGNSKSASATIMPLNATNRSIVWTSADETIATIDADGVVTGVALGSTTITGTLADGENVIEVSFTVTVKQGADNLYGYVLADLATYGGYAWASIDVADPTNNTIPAAENWYTMYSAEYVATTGMVYGYGYDDMDWESNRQFITFDADTYEIVSMVDLGDMFQTVYDLTYDYTTGTMYALAGYSETDADLYMVDLATGSLVLVMDLEIFGQSLVATEDGTLYFISDGYAEMDWWTWETIVVPSDLYAIDVAAGTFEYQYSLGYMSNMFSSAAYDYDTGCIYWSRFAQVDVNDATLCMIDLKEQTCYDLGTINAMGAQVTGLHFICDNYPEEPTGLSNIVITSASEQINVGETVDLDVLMQPASFAGEAKWSVSDESVASVDENGVVTGISSGLVTVTVTVVDGDKVFTATCKVAVFGENDYLLSYNLTDGSFAAIDRLDPTKVTNLTDPETYTGVRAMAMVGEVIYGYDMDGNFFSTAAYLDFQRTDLGHHGVAVLEADGYTCQFDVRDMAWDAANQRMLVLGCHSMVDEYGYWYEALGGCRLYTADLATGALTELCVLNLDGNEYSNIYTLTVADDGTIYTYSTFMDYFATVDATTGALSLQTSLQSQSVYGSSDGEPMAMAYDSITDTVYVLFTSNGNYYQMIQYYPSTGAAYVLGNVDEVVTSGWTRVGDSFAGLLINVTHEHTAGEEWETITEPTCTEPGLKGKCCTVCGEALETEEIPATGHQHTEVRDAKDPTCTEPGYTGDTYCTDCGEKIASGEEIPATGHQHTEVRDAKDPTCTEPGYTGDTYCTVCGEKVASGEAIPATGHQHTEVKDAKDPTCEDAGYTGDTYCTDCGEKVASGEEIPAKGHDYEDVVTPPTTTEGGYTTHTCKDCGHSYVDSYTDPIPSDNPPTGNGSEAMLWVCLLTLMSVSAVMVIFARKKQLF